MSYYKLIGQAVRFRLVRRHVLYILNFPHFDNMRIAKCALQLTPYSSVIYGIR